MKIFISVLLICILALSMTVRFDDEAIKLRDEALNRAT